MTLDEFRAAYPEMDASPDATVTYWLGVAKKFVDANRWAELAPFGEGLFVAHWLSVAAQAAKSASVGAVGGGNSGLLASKSVGEVSFSYDVSSVANASAGMWNRTSYGSQYWQLAQMFGNGAMQF